MVVDNVRSLENVGAIFRICDAAGVARLYLCGITGYPLAPNDPRPPWVAERAQRHIAKTALAALDNVAWEYRASAAEVVAELKHGGWQIVVLERVAGSINYRQAPYQFPLGLVVGHERAGVAGPVLDLADLVVEIPMYGVGKSLNVAVALGIVVYQVLQSG